MTFTQIEQAMDDPPIVAETSHQLLRQEAGAELALTAHEPAAPESKKRRRRVDDAFEDVRIFRRVRIYTSTEAGSTIVTTNMSVRVWSHGKCLGSSQCFSFRCGE